MQKIILLTGSSGFVGSSLYTRLNGLGLNVFGIDKCLSKTVDLNKDLADIDISDIPKADAYVVIHCAAARVDFGLSANEYYEMNITSTKSLLNKISAFNIEYFLHIGSVAALDGRSIDFSENLHSDDAYRSTKFLQEQEVVKFCNEKMIELGILIPSAIFDDSKRLDTNIGKLINFTNKYKIFPTIKIKKSLTYLPNFIHFIVNAINDKKVGYFLTIELPNKTVQDIIKINVNSKVRFMFIPGFKYFLYCVGWILEAVGKYQKKDPIITYSRAVKLYSDTTYSWALDKYKFIDHKCYTFETNGGKSD